MPSHRENKRPLALDTYFKKGLDAVENCLAACRVGAGPAISMDTYLGGDRKYRNDTS
jgi:hypothetical protein